MTSSLIQIGKSGAMAARSALELTAQNIANASNPDYARRTLSLEEVASRGRIGYEPGGVLSGVRPDQVLRSNSTFLQNEARRTSGDLARAEAELAGLSSAESAIEQAGIYTAIVDLEASLGQLASDPLGGALRAATLEDAERLTQTFRIASNGLDSAEADLRFQADAGITQANTLAQELARTNAGIARANAGSSQMAVLHDQRDALLRDLSDLAGITSSFDSLGQAQVQIDGQSLVSGTQAGSLSLADNPDGSFAVALDGTSVALSSGSILGQSQASEAMVDLRTQLDTLASGIIGTFNAAQASGSASDGSAGQPFFSGTGARDLSVALTAGSQIATAAAGEPAGSRNIANLAALRDTLATNGPASEADAVLFNLSSAISARGITRDALATIADTAQTALSAETAVDLDQEAANLLRYQQAFSANSRVIQAAADIFDTLLGIG